MEKTPDILKALFCKCCHTDNHLVVSIFDCGVDDGQLRDQKYLTAALAFLASRVLLPSKEHRCIERIQEAWQKSKLRRTIHQRCMLMRIAHDCKRAVKTRKRVTNAAFVVQRAWKAYRTRHARRYAGRVTGTSPSSNGGDDVDIWLLELNSDEEM